jgi:ParB/RepB/Spo0J family partition protein
MSMVAKMDRTEGTSTKKHVARKSTEATKPSAAETEPSQGDEVTVEVVRLENIDREDLRFQYRLGAAIADLKRSIAAEGLREPIDLLDTKPYRIIDGFRRVASISALGGKSVKALIHTGLSEEEAHTHAFLKNVVRRNLSSSEKAQAVCKALERGVNVKDVARHLGLAEKQVRRYEELGRMPTEIQDLVTNAVLSMAQAVVLAKTLPPDVRRWAELSVKNSWSAATLKKEILKATGKSIGKRRQYVRREKSVLRVYPFSISRTAPQDERKHVADLLREAIDFLESDLP